MFTGICAGLFFAVSVIFFEVSGATCSLGIDIGGGTITRDLAVSFFTLAANESSLRFFFACERRPYIYDVFNGIVGI